MVNLDSQREELLDILSQTLLGRGNTSVVLFGKHGVGKTALVYDVLNRLQQKFGQSSFITIYLNGQLQTDDVQALQFCFQKKNIPFFFVSKQNNVRFCEMHFFLVACFFSFIHTEHTKKKSCQKD